MVQEVGSADSGQWWGVPPGPAPPDEARPTPDWAWGGSRGEGVRVAVIDSGVDATHPALGGRIAGYCTVSNGPDGPCTDTTPHGDAVGHGTACAGIIRAIAPACALYSIKVAGAEPGPCLAAGLRWAIAQGIQVCNLSLSTARRDGFGLLHELAEMAELHQVLLVTAANNMPVPGFSALYDELLTVAAQTGKDPTRFVATSELPGEFGAPGLDVRIAWQHGEWITASGHSFAAPHLTGMIARVLGKHPDLPPAQMKAVLRAVAARL